MSSKKLWWMVVLMLGMGLCACGDDSNGDEGEGEGAPAGEGEGEGTPTGEGEGEGTPTGEGEGEGIPTGEGEGEGTPTGEGEGEGAEDCAAPLPACAACPADGKTYMSVTGKLQVLGTESVANRVVIPIEPMKALMLPQPPSLKPGDPAITDACGRYQVCCVDITNVTLGLVMMVDDNPQDWAAGELLPTGTGVASIPAAELVIDDAPIMAVPHSLMAGLNALTGKSGDNTLEKKGFVLGLLINETTRAPIAGATLIETDKDGNPKDNSTVTFKYLKADFSGFVEGGTSEAGLWLIPDPISLKYFKGVKDGMTFSATAAAGKANFSYFSIIRGKEQ